MQLVDCGVDGLDRSAASPLDVCRRTWCCFAGVVLALFKQQSPQHDQLSIECFNWLKVTCSAVPVMVSHISTRVVDVLHGHALAVNAGVAGFPDQQCCPPVVRRLHGGASAH